MTIVEFLEARIAEDAEVARMAFATPHDDGIWTAGDPDDPDADHVEYIRGEGILIYPEGGHDRDQAEHIARWNPARVLTECAAKRAIVGAAGGGSLRMRADAPPIEWTTALDVDSIGWRYTDWGGEYKITPTAEFYEMFFEPAPPNKTMRALASVWAGHPDFDPAWAL